MVSYAIVWKRSSLQLRIDAFVQPPLMATGYLGLLVLNQGGANVVPQWNELKRLDLQTHRCHIQLLQEHTNALLRPGDDLGWLSLIPPRCSFCEENGHHEGLAIRCRSTTVKEIEMLDFVCHADGRYREKKQDHFPRIPLLCAKIHFQDKLKREPLVVLNLHFNHNTAKKRTGLAAGHKEILSIISAWCSRYQVDVIAGDFNRALMSISPVLKEPPYSVVTHLVHYAKWDVPPDEPVPDVNHDCLGIVSQRASIVHTSQQSRNIMSR
jgi:hypothetical protein